MRGSAARALLPGLLVLALVGVVGVAATGSPQRSSDERRPPPDILLDTFITLGALAWVAGAALLIYGLTQRKAIAREFASGNYRRTSVFAYLAFALLFGIFWQFFRPNYQGSRRTDEGETESIDRFLERPPRPEGRGYEPEIAWLPVVVLVALVVVAIGAHYLAARRRERMHALRQTTLAARVADVVDESLDDLRAEPDPRRAVIAAYARLERALGASGAPRARQETAEEYVSRILGTLEVDDGVVRRLADLFTRAKFSHHVVDETMKQEAIAALARIRDELRSAARRRLEETTRRLAERTATS